MSPASHVRFATVEVLAPAPLTEVEGVLSEQTSAICGSKASTSATCTHNNPAVSCVRAMVPEEHPRMTTTLKHLKSHQMPPSANAPSGHTIAPAMQAIVVDCVPIVNPQLAPIIRVNAEVVRAFPEDPQAACPTHGEVISASKTGPSATCIAIVDHLARFFSLHGNAFDCSSMHRHLLNTSSMPTHLLDCGFHA